MKQTRRDFLKTCGALACAGTLPALAQSDTDVERYLPEEDPRLTADIEPGYGKMNWFQLDDYIRALKEKSRALNPDYKGDIDPRILARYGDQLREHVDTVFSKCWTPEGSREKNWCMGKFRDYFGALPEEIYNDLGNLDLTNPRDADAISYKLDLLCGAIEWS